MVCVPDLMTLAADGDDAQVRDVQGKMIAHCESVGDRMAILDPPPGLLPQEVLEWRMNTAGYDSKFATLYYPWIEVMDPLTRQPMMVPPSGHMAGVWARTDAPAASTRRRPTRSCWAPTASASRSRTRSRAASTGRASTASARSPAAASASGAPARSRAIPSGGTSTSAGSSTTSPSRSWRARSGPCSSPTTSGCGSRLRISVANFLTRTWRDGRAVRGHPGARRSTSSATPRPTRPR